MAGAGEMNMAEKIVVDQAAFDTTRSALSSARYVYELQSNSLDKKLKAGITAGAWTNANQAEFLAMCDAINAVLSAGTFNMYYMMNLMKQAQVDMEKADAAAANAVKNSKNFISPLPGNNRFGNNIGDFGSR